MPIMSPPIPLMSAMPTKLTTPMMVMRPGPLMTPKLTTCMLQKPWMHEKFVRHIQADYSGSTRFLAQNHRIFIGKAKSWVMTNERWQ